MRPPAPERVPAARMRPQSALCSSGMPLERADQLPRRHGQLACHGEPRQNLQRRGAHGLFGDEGPAGSSSLIAIPDQAVAGHWVRHGRLEKGGHSCVLVTVHTHRVAADHLQVKCGDQRQGLVERDLGFATANATGAGFVLVEGLSDAGQWSLRK